MLVPHFAEFPTGCCDTTYVLGRGNISISREEKLRRKVPSAQPEGCTAQNIRLTAFIGILLEKGAAILRWRQQEALMNVDGIRRFHVRR